VISRVFVFGFYRNFIRIFIAIDQNAGASGAITPAGLLLNRRLIL
jgi:hypothetical protein